MVGESVATAYPYHLSAQFCTWPNFFLIEQQSFCITNLDDVDTETNHAYTNRRSFD